ncbi:MAG: hypothetical protein EB119_04560 [Synechococcaceae bacterium WBB_34_004]|nr:hypothetical protein [Synechococcaceae bacterium WBB_34_004]
MYHVFPAVSLPQPKNIAVPFCDKVPVTFTFAAVNPVANVNAELTVTLPNTKLPRVAFVNTPLDPVTFVACIVPMVPDVAITLVAVTFVNAPVVANSVPVVSEVTNILPIVESETTIVVPVAFVKRMFPNVPDVAFSPVMVAEFETNVLIVTPVACKVPVVTLVNCAFTPCNDPVDNVLTTTREPVVKLPDTATLVAVTFVATTFAKVLAVNNTLPDVTVVATIVPAVPFVKIMFVAVMPVKSPFPMDTSVACKFVVVTLVAKTFVNVLDVTTKLSVVILLNVPEVANTEPVVNVPVTKRLVDVNPVVTVKLVAVTEVSTALLNVALVVAKFAVLTLVVPTSEPTVKLGKLKLAIVTLLPTKLVNVALAALILVDNTFVNAPVPATSKVKAGLVVLIPMLPPVKYMLPIVFDEPTTVNPELTYIVPTDKFVSTKLVVVTFVSVSVPETVKLPDKLSVPPVMVVATKLVVVTLVNVALVPTSVAAVTFVPSKLLVVMVPAAKLAVLTLVVARSVPTVAPVPITILVELTLVITALVTVILVAFIVPVLKDVTVRVLVVKPDVTTSEPNVKLPAKFRLPSVTVR